MTAAYGPITRRDDTDHQFLRVALGPGPGPASNGGVAQDQTAFTTPPTVPTTYNGIVLTAPGSGLAWVNDSLLTSDCAGNPGGRHGCPPTIPPPATDPTDYPFLRVSSVTLTLTDPEPPTATVAGQLAALTARGWTNTRASIPVLISAADPTSGVASMAISDEHAHQALSMPAGCDPTHHQPYGGRVCPPTATANLNFNIGALGEGIHTLTATATDYSTQTSRPTHLTLRIDRTPPRMLALHAVPRARGTRIAWPPAIDRESGTAYYETRTTGQGQPPGPWQRTGARQLIIPTITGPLTVEARATDHAANTGSSQAVEVAPHGAPAPRRPSRRPIRRPQPAGCGGRLRFSTDPLPGPQDRRQQPVACAARLDLRTINRLAKTLRPALFFSARERWRPLDVAALFRHEHPQLCAAHHAQCKPTKGLSDLLSSTAGVNYNTPRAELRPGGGLLSPNDFRSPDKRCTILNARLDCDNGIFYYHGTVTTIGSGDLKIRLVKIDYWIYYRFNHAPAGGLTCRVPGVKDSKFCDEHASDWEGLTISVPIFDNKMYLDTAQIQYARHAKFAVPLYHWRDSFCADLDPEGNRRCGAHGQRPIAFVADGTHASYPSRCATPFQCFQPRALIPEGDYSGDVPWPGNDRANAVVPFHNGPENGWQFWKGNWNKDPHVRVESPGNQDRYAATSNDPRATVVSARAGRSQPLGDCASWIAGAQVAVCDPVALQKAAEAFDFGSPGTVSITTLPGAYFDSSPGLAQTMGDPLTVGQHVDITGRSGTRTFIEVTYIVGTYLTTADLPAGLENGGTAHLSITPAGASIMLPDGRVATGRVIISRDLAQPAAPEISLRRLGRTQHARLNVLSQTPTVEVVFRDRHTHRIGPLHRRIVLVGRARGLRFILPRFAFYLSVQSLDAHGKRSLASYVVIDPVRRRHRRHP